MKNNQTLRDALHRNDIDTILDMVRSKQVKAFYVFHQLSDFQTAEKVRQAAGYKPGFWHYNLDRFPRLKQAVKA
jgi:hypothetical protein